VWRTTPAGSPAGPVPQRIVLVETGPDGFAPSTAYRVEHALRRAGIRAAVEVVQAGTELSDYHGDALAVARRLSLRSVRWHEPHEAGDSSLFADPPAPRPVTTTRRRSTAGAHAERRPAAEHAAGRWQGRGTATEEAPAAEAEPEPAATYDDAYSDTHPPEHALRESAEPFADDVRPSQPDMGEVEPADVLPEPEAVAEPVAGTADAPLAVVPPATGADPAEADLSNRERELLRQLHEELAKREQGEPEAGWQPVGREPNPPGTAFDPADFQQPTFDPNEFGGPAWRQQADHGADQTAVNGIPPYGSTGA
jgi:hypothetical protein